MEAKDIIVKLIDEHKITGEEAVILLDAIYKEITITTPNIPSTRPYETPWPIMTWYSTNTE